MLTYHAESHIRLNSANHPLFLKGSTRVIQVARWYAPSTATVRVTPKISAALAHSLANKPLTILDKTPACGIAPPSDPASASAALDCPWSGARVLIPTRWSRAA